MFFRHWVPPIPRATSSHNQLALTKFRRRFWYPVKKGRQLRSLVVLVELEKMAVDFTRFSKKKLSDFLLVKLPITKWEEENKRRLTPVLEAIFTRFIRVKRTDRKCLSIQTQSDEFKCDRRETVYELNSLNCVRCMRNSTCGVGIKELFILFDDIQILLLYPRISL